MTKPSSFDLMTYIKPLLRFVPDIQRPSRAVPLKDRLVWTLLTLLVFLVSSQVPLFGIQKLFGEDPVYWSRMIMASNRGTLMELGIGPIITAGMVVQFLTSAQLIKLGNSTREERELGNQLQKFVAICVSIFQAVSHIFMGNYGDPKQLGTLNIFMIVIQLIIACFIVIMLDDLLTKGGYGLVSAVSLFIATNVCEDLLWKSFSFLKVREEYEGAFVAFFSYLYNTPNKFAALKKGFLREGLTNVYQVIATVGIFLVVSYFQGFQSNVSIHDKRQQGHVDSYGVKLFYTSNTPIIVLNSVVSNLLFISKIIHNNFKHIKLIRYLGVWKNNAIGGQSYPVGGLIYYITPPGGIKNIIQNPLHGFVYIVFVLLSCSLISRFYVTYAGNGAKEITENLKSQHITAYGGTPQMLQKRLDRNIQVASYLGGFFIGALTLLADFLGAIGSGTGILLTCGIIVDLQEEFRKAFAQGHSLW
jgi:protein transport protein SEC61 subunit alpha